MFCARYLLYCILVHSIVARLQINLFYTDWINGTENDYNNLQHNCLRVPDSSFEDEKTTALSIYCMSEPLSKFIIENNTVFPHFTFANLAKWNITSQQLYLWSAPIDIAERYQSYLDQLFTSSDNLTMASAETFYNCTLPRFGPRCQYELEYYSSPDSSLFFTITTFYETYKYHPTTLTCYMHLRCDRGPLPACLDWTEICDGQVDCLDGNFDEEHCWQMELNECNEDEYRCANGQCIPRLFYGDVVQGYDDCMDGSDQLDKADYNEVIFDQCIRKEIVVSFHCEDILCKRKALTSSCTNDRRHLLLQAMLSIRDQSIPDRCWSAFKCIMHVYKMDDPTCNDVCSGKVCAEIINRTCPDAMFIPAVPIQFGQIYLAYQKNVSDIFFSDGELRYLYMCYNNSYYDDYYKFPTNSAILINNTKCYRRYGAPRFSKPVSLLQDLWLLDIHGDLKKYYQIFNNNSTFCNRSNVYHCANSVKCISKHRRSNKITDCPHGDDEEEIYSDPMFSTDQFLISGSYWHQWYKNLIRYIRLNISFLTVCNGYTELLPILIGEQNETDETECEQWECNNIYTRCNYYWNCPNGADELGCDTPFQFDCSPNEHLCMSPVTNDYMCLRIEKANDGNVDCLGGTDEPALCRRKYEFNFPDTFYCRNSGPVKCIDAEKLCDGHNDCEYGDDEQFCDPDWPRFDGIADFCHDIDDSMRPAPINFLCRTIRGRITYPLIPSFSLVEPLKLTSKSTKDINHRALSSPAIAEISRQYQPRCHRGLDLLVWLNANNHSTTRTCFCPPNFYGDTCQYQNQRVSLALRFRALSASWRTPFAIIVSLTDDSEQRLIHSTEQFTYLPTRDCGRKFNIYLLYSTRPKNESNNYTIHIDIYQKISLSYHGSVLYSIPFPFLPFHRLAFIVDIGENDYRMDRCFDRPCVHGKCLKYLNHNNENKDTFCKCDRGWSGRDCTIPYTHTCSPNSEPLGVSANNRQAVCVCPVDRFGPRCLMKKNCQNNHTSLCKNGGQCIPDDEYTKSSLSSTCLCPEGFLGVQCQKKTYKIILSFDNDIILSQTIFIHFIYVEAFKEGKPLRATTFATSPVKQDSLIVYWSKPFHIVFVELAINKYYLVLIQLSYRESSMFKETITSSNHCPHISEVFNQTFAELHPLRRIKYYHSACQNNLLNLSCFYDHGFLCLCTDYYNGKRHANCFEFDHNMTLNCLGLSECQNDARCFQDDSECPTKAMCACPPCFYGRLCQFSTSGFGLSLDAILGYHILPHTSISQQSVVVKISIAFAVIIMVAGFINGILALLTFKSKVVLEVGCGLYLLCSSITVLFTTILFGLKFWILILSQMGVILDKSFLLLQCKSIDFLLRICLNMDQWLSACVAIERAVTVIKGVNFNKQRSRHTAKYVTVIVLIINILSCMYDCIYRRLIQEGNDDNNGEKRIWCIVTSSHHLQVLNSAIYIFHFVGPFMINFISVLILIKKKSHQQTNLRSNRAFKVLLREQFREHKHLFTAPVLLVVLAILRLIILFVSKCMQSANDFWIFLLGYFVSFIPPLLTFMIFVLPSTVYKKAFHKNVAQLRMNIQRWLHINE